MSIQRIDPGPRMSSAVVHGDTIYVAGKVASDAAKGRSVTEQTRDILGQIECDTVELHLADAGAPTLIRQNEKSAALYVLMPMRV